MRDCVGAKFDIRAGRRMLATAFVGGLGNPRESNALFHNDVSQGIAHGVALFDELERGGRICRAGQLHNLVSILFPSLLGSGGGRRVVMSSQTCH